MLNELFLVFILCLYYNQTLKSKFNNIFTYIISLLAISTCLFITSFFIKDLFILSITRYILIFIYIYLIFDDKLYIKFYINNNLFLTLCEAKIIIYSVFSIIRGDSINNLILNNTVNKILCFSSFMLFGVIIFISIKFWNNETFGNLKKDYVHMRYLNIITVILFFVMLGLEYLSVIQFNIVYIYSYYALFLVIITGIGNSTFISNLNTLSKNRYIKTKLDILQQQMEFQIEHYKNYEKHIQETRRMWHDINNHFSIINILMIKKEYEKVEDYINSLNGVLSNFTLKTICNHKILDALLTSKLRDAEEKNINFDVSIKIPNETNFNNIDLCCIFGNLINNAIEACDNVENNKYISLKSAIKQGHLIISIQNPYTHQLNYKNFKFSTTKSDKLNHGIGLNSIKKSVNNYNGNMEISTKNNIFDIRITMQEPKK